MNPNDLLDVLTPNGGEQTRKLGYVSSSYTSGRPKIRFDGETADSTKGYPFLESYTPAAGDRVALVLFNHSWVVIGKII